MRNTLRYITSIIVAVLFLISSTGIYLTIHYCSSEDITKLFFFTPLTEEPCEHHANDHNESNCCSNRCDEPTGSEPAIFCGYPINNSENCSIHSELAVCCSNTVFYIVVEDDFVKTDQLAIYTSYVLLQSVFVISLIETILNNNYFTSLNFNPSSPKLHGKELVFFYRTLLL